MTVKGRIDRKFFIAVILTICFVYCGVHFFGQRNESVYCKVVTPIYRITDLHPEFEGFINDSIVPAIQSLNCDLSKIAFICLLEEDYVALNVYKDRQNVPLNNDSWHISYLPVKDGINIFVISSEWYDSNAILQEKKMEKIPSDMLPTFRLFENMHRDLLYTDTLTFMDSTVFFEPPSPNDIY